MKDQDTATASPASGVDRNAVILGHLRRIQDSHAFGNSARAKEFLSYVVEHGLEGHTELLKERSIGVHLFHRSPTYVTSDDPIVRVKAAEVRKRLAQYYAEEKESPGVRIEIPVGSYVPRFEWNVPPAEAAATEVATPIETETTEAPAPPRWPRWAVAAGVALVGVAAAIGAHIHVSQNRLSQAFWAPIFSTSQHLLICVPTPVAYAINSQVYRRAAQTHPGLYDTQVDRENTPIQLDPEADLKWRDVTPLVDYYVNKDDAYVATDLAALFARLHKGSQVRMGHDFTYEDLRHSPAVLIGAFDNVLAIRVGGELPFVFRQQDGAIVEKGGSGRVWKMEVEKNRGPKDFAIVARLVNSKTGQFMAIVGGIGMVGTQAAGSLISQPAELNAVLETIPQGWQQKNLEIVIETDVIDATASRPKVVAYTAW